MPTAIKFSPFPNLHYSASVASLIQSLSYSCVSFPTVGSFCLAEGQSHRVAALPLEPQTTSSGSSSACTKPLHVYARRSPIVIGCRVGCRLQHSPVPLSPEVGSIFLGSFCIYILSSAVLTHYPESFSLTGSLLVKSGIKKSIPYTPNFVAYTPAAPHWPV